MISWSRKGIERRTRNSLILQRGDYKEVADDENRWHTFHFLCLPVASWRLHAIWTFLQSCRRFVQIHSPNVIAHKTVTCTNHFVQEVWRREHICIIMCKQAARPDTIILLAHDVVNVAGWWWTHARTDTCIMQETTKHATRKQCNQPQCRIYVLGLTTMMNECNAYDPATANVAAPAMQACWQPVPTRASRAGSCNLPASLIHSWMNLVLIMHSMHETHCM
jgi:hypothetical protein